MKLKVFDVVKLKNGNKATIKEVLSSNFYKVEIVDKYGNTIENRNISKKEIKSEIKIR